MSGLYTTQRFSRFLTSRLLQLY